MSRLMKTHLFFPHWREIELVVGRGLAWVVRASREDSLDSSDTRLFLPTDENIFILLYYHALCSVCCALIDTYHDVSRS